MLEFTQGLLVRTSSYFLVALMVTLMSPVILASDVDRVILGTATKGGGFQLFGQNLAEVINATDKSLQVEAIATKGSRQNIPFLEEGKIDIGQVEGNAARQALDGIGRKPADLKVLSVMYPNPGMFVVRADSSYRTIDDLKGKPIAFGTSASGLRILVNDVLDGLGLKQDVDFQQIILKKAAEGPALVLDRQAEALWGAGIGWPGFVKVANGPAGARFIAPDDQQIEQILKKHPHLIRMNVPAGTYKGQNETIRSLGLWSLILVRPDVDDDIVYRLARAIHHGHDQLVQRLAQGAYTKAENTVANVAAHMLHPGAQRYYREIGLLQ
jgi:TRAP transporter TAXI family solute receptor